MRREFVETWQGFELKEYLNRRRKGRKGMRGKDAAHAGHFWFPIQAAAFSTQHFACFAASVQTLHLGGRSFLTAAGSVRRSPEWRPSQETVGAQINPHTNPLECWIPIWEGGHSWPPQAERVFEQKAQRPQRHARQRCRACRAFLAPNLCCGVFAAALRVLRDFCSNSSFGRAAIPDRRRSCKTVARMATLPGNGGAQINPHTNPLECWIAIREGGHSWPPQAL